MHLFIQLVVTVVLFHWEAPHPVKTENTAQNQSQLAVRQLLCNTNEYPDIRSLTYPDIWILRSSIRCRPIIQH